MKKTISLILAVILVFGIVCLTGCSSKPDFDVDRIDSYMTNDETVVIIFENTGKKTISHIKGNLNLFSGDATNQTPLKTASFEWNGTCEAGNTFTVTATVNNPPVGLSSFVNRIGFTTSVIE
ncbi:MAG: hypothetical protein E7647_04485 [Ruminococcaceae bacterium]|nr:hypothetical protein [Oscillospiraceae bacterium]